MFTTELRVHLWGCWCPLPTTPHKSRELNYLAELGNQVRSGINFFRENSSSSSTLCALYKPVSQTSCVWSCFLRKRPRIYSVIVKQSQNRKFKKKKCLMWCSCAALKHNRSSTRAHYSVLLKLFHRFLLFYRWSKYCVINKNNQSVVIICYFALQECTLNIFGLEQVVW